MRGWLLWSCFVVYGSLLPFELRATTWADAVEQFTRIPWLELGLDSRIDWLANLLLYIPVGWLGVVAFARPGSIWSRLVWPAIGVATAGIALAITVEFTQIFFAPRTVSLNDLAAEGVGVVLGVAGALTFGPVLLGIAQRALSSTAGARTAWLHLYLLAYLALAFFPFDFTSPGAVLAMKLDRGHAGWMWAPINWSRPVLAVVKLAGEALMVVPFGIALARSGARTHWLVAALLGALAGAAIEGVQLFLLSATSQGLSVLSRACGMALGAAAAPHLPGVRRLATTPRLRALVALGSPLWLVAAAAMSGWGQHAPTVTGWIERAQQVRLLPFYYHYYSGEAGALTSVLLCVGIYLWVGVGAAMVAPRSRAWTAALVAMLVALLLESSQLFLVGRKPDPTNILLAGAISWLTFRLSVHLALDATYEPKAVAIESAITPPLLSEQHVDGGMPLHDGAGWIGVLTLATVVSLIHAFHGHPIALAAAIIAFAVGIWIRPSILPMVLPSAIVLTDLDSYLGLRAFDALDAVMAAALISVALRRQPRRESASFGASRWPPGLLALFGLIPAVAVGLQGSGAVDWHALLSPLDAARTLWLAKGVVWAAGFAVAVRQLDLDLALTGKLLARGMTIALGGVVVMTLFERLAFVSLLDFATAYRAPGPFSAIALGGAYIEAFLAAAAPFAVVCALQERSLGVRWACMALVLAAAYATMITYSRGGQVVFLAVVVLTAAWASWRRLAPSARAAGRPAILLVAAVAALSAVVLAAPFATARFNTLGSDAQTRFSHWSHGLSLGGSGLGPLIAGNGLGRFGRDAYVQGAGGGRPGAFTWHRQDGVAWLTAHAGSLSYLDQRVSVAYGDKLTLTARLRSSGAESLGLLLCEKDLVQSLQCGLATLKVTGDGQWHTVTAPLTLALHSNVGWPPRPVRLSLYKGDGRSIDVASISLRDSGGKELLSNGNFDAGTADWFYSSDMHLVWHLKNLWLQVYYECGLIGTLAMAWLLLAAAWGAWRAAARGQPAAFALLMALVAVHGVGLIDSVIDTQRFLSLYLWLCLIGCSLGALAGPGLRPARR